jgi:hypothetical protein
MNQAGTGGRRDEPRGAHAGDRQLLLSRERPPYRKRPDFPLDPGGRREYGNGFQCRARRSGAAASTFPTTEECPAPAGAD